MTTRTVLCKVCGVVVPRRKDYHPSVCEACQKFFRRCCKKLDEVKCKDGRVQCKIDGKTRRLCDMCRFKRCCAAGMRSKYLIMSEVLKMGIPVTEANTLLQCRPSDDTISLKTSNSSEDKQSSESDDFMDDDAEEPIIVKQQETAVVCKNHLTLISQPVLYDGETLEKIIRTSTESFTHLHALEFLELKRPRAPVEDPDTFLRLAKSQLDDTFSAINSFGKCLITSEVFRDLFNSEMNSLSPPAVVCVITIFNNLLGNRGASFFGVKDSVATRFLSWHPEFQEVKSLCDAMSATLEEWNPTLVETSILLSYLCFKDSKSAEMQRLCRLLRIGLELYLSRKHKGDQETAINKEWHFFEKCVRLMKVILRQLYSCIFLIGNEKPLYSWARAALGQSQTALK